jgi:hypothetical protein
MDQFALFETIWWDNLDNSGLMIEPKATLRTLAARSNPEFPENRYPDKLSVIQSLFSGLSVTNDGVPVAIASNNEREDPSLFETEI